MQKKAYAAPTITVLGSLASLTQGTDPGVLDQALSGSASI
ncbi:MAG TPA: lasso RiPP family leader peptide-containing protein [Solirubrobacteraceae bacterium]|nr:lasso RiPP family leader peptide-containing protein [Solirubrobacteraceae bacterium]